MTLRGAPAERDSPTPSAAAGCTTARRRRARPSSSCARGTAPSSWATPATCSTPGIRARVRGTLDLDDDVRWTGLGEVLATTGGSLLAAEGTVEFRASYVHDRRAAAQHENSRFVREDGHWRYLDGVSLG